MKIYLEIFGYSGTFLVLLSMMMTSVVKLRVFNIIGSVITMTYAFLSKAFPVVFLNAGLIIINVIQLVRLYGTKKLYRQINVKPSDAFLCDFLNQNSEDIKSVFPTFKNGNFDNADARIICCGNEIVGVWIANIEKDEGEILLDYVIPERRDTSVATYLFSCLKDEGITKLTTEKGTDSHCKYLIKMGFKLNDNIMIKQL